MRREGAFVSLLFILLLGLMILMLLEVLGAIADYARPDVARLLGFLDNLAGVH